MHIVPCAMRTAVASCNLNGTGTKKPDVQAERPCLVPYLQVGMLVSCSDGGRLWTVMWAKGGRGTYATGLGNVWELSHLEVPVGAGTAERADESYCSGAPVVDEADLAVGCGVVRGLHWTWEEQDGGEGTLGSVQLDDRKGERRGVGGAAGQEWDGMEGKGRRGLMHGASCS